MLRTLAFRLCTIFLLASLCYSPIRASETTTLPHPPDTVPHFIDDTLLDKDVGFNALVRLERTDGYTCTGVAIRTNENANSPAYVISTGHCHWLLYHEVVTDLIPKGSKKLKAHFNPFHDASASEQFKVNVKRINYASMRGHDLAILELNATQGQLAARKILLPKLATTVPQGLSVSTYGIRASDPFIRAVNCTLTNRVNLNEGKWLWWDALQADCPRADLISGGASGSPVYLQGTAKELFGILNTINPEPVKNILCSENNPCELKSPKPVSRLKGVYLMDVHELGHCFTASGQFNRQLKRCPLPKKLAVYTSFKRIPDPTIDSVDQRWFDQQARYPNPAHQQTNYIFQSTLATKSYQMHLVKPDTAAAEAYRYKLSPLASFDSYDASGYSEATRSPTLSLSYPTEVGTYIASLIPVKNYNQDRLNPLDLYVDIFEIVYKNSLKIAKITITNSFPSSNVKKVTINKITGNELLANSIQFLGYQLGSKATTNCANFKNYTQVYYSHPMETTVGAIKSGDKLCLILVDRALNATQPYEYIHP